MAETWEWGPWAQQGEDYVKSEREKQTKLDVQKQASDNALRNLLAGKAQDQTYKIADEDRQAGYAVPALRQLITGNKDVGKALGYGEQTPAQIAVPEAGYPGAAPTYKEPTDEDLRGFAKAVPGMTQTILGKQLEGTKPITVGKDASLVSPTGQELFHNKGTEQQGGISFPTPEAADAYWNAWKQRDPEGTKVYAPNIQADPVHGGYKLNLNRGEALSIQDPFRQEFDRNVRAGMDPAKATNLYQDRLAAAAGARQFAVTQNTPASPDQVNALIKVQSATQAFGQLQSFTEPERRAFVLGPSIYGMKGTFNKEAWFNWLSGIPGGGGIVNTLGGKQATLDRFNQFHALLGTIRQLAFVTGGKQLSKSEEDTVMASLPSGKEASYAEFQAKFNYAELVMKATNQAIILGQQIPKGDPEYDQKMGNIYRQVFSQYGISLVDDKHGVRSQMDPNERLKQKYSKGTPNG